MKHKATLILGILLTVGGSVLSSEKSTPSKCLGYQPALISMSGVLERRTFPGRPNFESVAAGDEPETGFYLALPRAACFSAGSDPDASNLRDVRLVQLNLKPEQYDQLRPYLGKTISIQGAVYEAMSGHHHAPVVLMFGRLLPGS
jgi:hypothetical protein